MIEITDSPDMKQWSEFVLNHPQGNIFQTPEMAEVYRRTKNYEPVTLAAFNTKNDLPFIIIKGYLKLIREKRYTRKRGEEVEDI